MVPDEAEWSSCQLRGRRWNIRSPGGEEEVVEGDGVVGNQPLLRATGEPFEYTSCTVERPGGSMGGHFVMVPGRCAGRWLVAPAPLTRARAPHSMTNPLEPEFAAVVPSFQLSTPAAIM